jgi:hypothetical protein
LPAPSIIRAQLPEVAHKTVELTAREGRTSVFRVAKVLHVPLPHTTCTAGAHVRNQGFSLFYVTWKGKRFSMRTNQDTELKSVISFLRELADAGTLEPGQKEAITKEIHKLRRAIRSHDPAKIRAAVANVARIFLCMHGR